MKSVIFDLDGTLADTSGDLLAAANHCFQDMGYGNVLTPEIDAGVAVQGGRMMLTVGLKRIGALDEAVIDRYYPVLLEAYKGSICQHTYLYPGAMDAVAALKSQGFGVGICTNKPEGLAHQLLEELNVLKAFDALVGGDTLPVRKPNPEPLFETVRRLGGDLRQSLLVGDTHTDRNTSKAANIPSVLVTFGPNGEDMSALDPEALLDDYAALPSVVQALLGPA